jgi:hypothetical protein
MTFRKAKSLPGIAVACIGVLVSISACGSESTGPGDLDSSAALQSLARGMDALSADGSPATTPLDPSFGGIAPLLDKINVTIDGKSQTMFALGVRETFPAGTCEEDIFIDPTFPPEPGVCTPPPAGLVLILWQSHSASLRPDRLIVIVSEVGTTDFDFLSSVTLTTPAFLATALYLAGEEIWGSLSGTLTSQVAATAQPCGLPLPPYAKAASCSVAIFDEQGAIVFEPYSESIPSTRQLNLTIPRQSIHGLWQSITQTQPVTFPAFSRTSRWLGF